MDVPLSRFLACFSSEGDANADVDLVQASAPADDIAEGEIASAEPSDAAEAEREAQVAALKANYEAALSEKLTASRESWCAEEGARLAASIDAGLAELELRLADQLANALRPLMRPAVVARAVDALAEAFDAARVDPRHAPLKVRGPSDLLDAIVAARPFGGSIELIRDEGPEVIVEAEHLYVATRLGDALALIAQEA